MAQLTPITGGRINRRVDKKIRDYVGGFIDRMLSTPQPDVIGQLSDDATQVRLPNGLLKNAIVSGTPSTYNQAVRVGDGSTYLVVEELVKARHLSGGRDGYLVLSKNPVDIDQSDQDYFVRHISDTVYHKIDTYGITALTPSEQLTRAFKVGFTPNGLHLAVIGQDEFGEGGETNIKWGALKNFALTFDGLDPVVTGTLIQGTITIGSQLTLAEQPAAPSICGGSDTSSSCDSSFQNCGGCLTSSGSSSVSYIDYVGVNEATLALDDPIIETIVSFVIGEDSGTGDPIIDALGSYHSTKRATKYYYNSDISSATDCLGFPFLLGFPFPPGTLDQCSTHSEESTSYTISAMDEDDNVVVDSEHSESTDTTCNISEGGSSSDSSSTSNVRNFFDILAENLGQCVSAGGLIGFGRNINEKWGLFAIKDIGGAQDVDILVTKNKEKSVTFSDGGFGCCTAHLATVQSGDPHSFFQAFRSRHDTFASTTQNETSSAYTWRKPTYLASFQALTAATLFVTDTHAIQTDAIPASLANLNPKAYDSESIESIRTNTLLTETTIVDHDYVGTPTNDWVEQDEVVGEVKAAGYTIEDWVLVK